TVYHLNTFLPPTYYFSLHDTPTIDIYTLSLHDALPIYKLMKDPKVVQALQTKQEAMLQESGEHLARTLPLSRADVIDRLWELAQLAPERTHRNITGQVKAAQALEQIFALNIDGNDLLKRQLQEKSEAEIQFYVV